MDPNIITPGQDSQQSGQPQPPQTSGQQPASQFFPSNPSAIRAEQQQQAMALSPAVRQAMSNSSLEGRRPVKLIIAVALLAILLVSASAFAYWAFTERQKYKNDTDKIVAVAVARTEKTTTEKNNKKFAEELKNPLTNYTGPSSYGSISVDYPKTWSAYAKENEGGNSPFDAYFHPEFVPNVEAKKDRQAVALHVQVVNQTYDKVLAVKDKDVKSGKLTSEPYALEKNSDVEGMIFRGQLDTDLEGTQIVLPLRDKTIIITTETDTYLADINQYILPNLTFVP